MSFTCKKDLVAFRIGVEQEYVDYDLDMALMVLKDKFEKKGYKVGDFAYSGNLYPKELDEAKINVFVRGFIPFYDKRFGDETVNIFYVHRVDNLIKQEFDNYDYYLASQKSTLTKFKDSNSIDYFGTDNIERRPIKGNYACNVLYIYEFINKEYADYLSFDESAGNNKVISGSKFYHLSYKEKVDMLKECKVVLYAKGVFGVDDEDYIPYAIYDIMSYGVPIITNYNKRLADVFDGLLMFNSDEDMRDVTIKALKISDEERVKKALEYKEILDKQQIDDSFIEKYAKKNEIIRGYLDNIN